MMEVVENVFVLTVRVLTQAAEFFWCMELVRIFKNWKYGILEK